MLPKLTIGDLTPRHPCHESSHALVRHAADVPWRYASGAKLGRRRRNATLYSIIVPTRFSKLHEYSRLAADDRWGATGNSRRRERPIHAAEMALPNGVTRSLAYSWTRGSTVGDDEHCRMHNHCGGAGTTVKSSRQEHRDTRAQHCASAVRSQGKLAPLQAFGCEWVPHRLPGPQGRKIAACRRHSMDRPLGGEPAANLVAG